MSGIFGRKITSVIQIQSAFATFPSSGTWYPISAYERSEGETNPLENDPLLGRTGQHNGRDPQATAPGLPSGGGQSQVPMCLREHGFILTGLLGAPETSGSSPNYTHVFESGKDDLAYLAYSKKLADDWFKRGRGWCFNTYAINLAKEAGYPRATLGSMLRDEADGSSEVTGTIATAFTLLRPPSVKCFAKYNGVAAPFTQLSFNFSNQLQPNGEFNGLEYPNGFDADDVQLSASFTARVVDDAWEQIAIAKTAAPIEFGWAIDANKSITFRLPAARIARTPLSANAPGRLFKSYDVVPEQTDSEPALTVTLKNDVSGYPPPPPPPPPPP